MAHISDSDVEFLNPVWISSSVMRYFCSELLLLVLKCHEWIHFRKDSVVNEELGFLRSDFEDTPDLKFDNCG